MMTPTIARAIELGHYAPASTADLILWGVVSVITCALVALYERSQHDHT